MNWRIRHIIVLICALQLGSAYSQIYKFRPFDLRQGLLNSEIHDIALDQNGFMLLATANGLYSFNGNTFEQIETINFNLNKVTDINGVCYISTDHGVEVIDKSGDNCMLLPDQSVKDVFSFNNKTIALTSNGLYHIDGDSISRFYSSFTKEYHSVYLVDSSIWLSSKNNGVEVLRYDGDSWLSSPLSSNKNEDSPMSVRGVAQNKDGEIWIVSLDKGIQVYEDQMFYPIKYEGLGDILYSSLVYDSSSNSFWCGTWGSGLININRSFYQIYTESNGLSDNVISTLYMMVDGKLCIGSLSNGLSLFSPNGVKFFNNESGLSSNKVRDIEKLGDQIYLSTLGGLFSWDDIAIDTIITNNRVGPLHVDENIMYAGTYHGTVYSITNNNVAEELPISIGAEILDISTYKDKLYIGTFGKGLYSYNIKTQELYRHKTLPVNLKVTALYSDSEGLYIGTNNGLYLLNHGTKKTVKILPNDEVFSNIKVNQIGKEYNKSGLVVASERRGVFHYIPETQKVYNINKEDGLFSNSCRAFSYNNYDLILATNIDVSYIRFTKTGDNDISHLLNITEFGNREINPNAIYFDEDALWIGTGFGAVTFSTEAKLGIESSRNLTARIDLLETNETTIKLNTVNGTPTFSHSTRWLKFEIFPANYNSSKSKVYVRLDADDYQWQLLEDDNTAFFQNIKPGNYTIEYYIEDEFENKSEIKRLSFTIEAPYWQNWTFFAWFLSGLFVILGVLMYAFRPRVEQIERKLYLQQSVFISRLIMFFGALVYPLVSYIVTSSDDTIINPQTETSILVGLILLLPPLLSFVNQRIAKSLPLIIILAYTMVVFHQLVVIYINNIPAAHVMGLIIIIFIGSVIFAKMRDFVVFNVIVLALCTWVAYSAIEPHFTATLFIVLVFASVLVSVLLIGVRLHVVNRFQISDSILNNITSLVLVANKKNEIIYASKSVNTELGYKRKEVLGSGWWRIRGKLVQDEQSEKNTSLLAGDKKTISYKSPILTKSGEKRYYRWLDTPIQGGYIAGIGYDVTEQHHLETELEKLSIVAKSSQTGIVISNPNFEIEWVNESFEKITGYTNAELIGRVPGEILKANMHSAALIHECRTTRLDEGYTIETINYKKDGTAIWLNITGNAIKNDDGELIQVVEIIQDVSDRKDKEIKLEQLSLVASETDNYVIITDKEDHVLWTNKAFTEIFGYEFEDVEGMKVAEFLSTEILNPDEINNIRTTVFKFKNVYEGEFCDKTKSGNIIWISTTVTPVLDSNGEINYTIAVGSDITDRKISEFQIEQVSRSNELMHGIDSILINENDEEVVISKILDLMMSLNDDFQITSFIEFIRQEKRVRLVYTIRDKELTIVENEDVSHYNSLPTLKKGNTYLVDNILELDQLSDYDKFLLFNGVKSYLMTPVLIEGQLRGIIGVGSRRPHGFSDNDVETYQNIANSIAVVLLQREQAKTIINSEENFRQLNESISEAFWLSDYKTGELRYVNKVFNKLFGVSQEELYEDPKCWVKNIHPEDKTRVIRQFKEHAAEGRFDEIYRVNVNGAVKWVRSSAYPIKNNDGEIIKMSGASQDVTDIILREQDIMNLNKQLSSINTINKALLLNENIGEPLIGIIENIFDSDMISRINILRYNFDTGMASFQYKRNMSESIDEQSFSLDEINPVNLNTLKSGNNVIVEDIDSNDKQSKTDKVKLKTGTKSYIMYPLMYNNQLIGSLNIGFSKAVQISDYQNSFLKSLSNGISIAIHQTILLEMIENDKQTLELINKDISDSINYAKKFQIARLPDLDESLKSFSEYGLWYAPRDIVSGDFYWTHQDEKLTYIAVADCTGHGVPGAFMTLLFNTLLEKTIIEKEIQSPDDILVDLHKGIKDYFKSRSNISDGMDIVLITINKDSDEILYAGAKRPLLVFNKAGKTFITYDPNLISIGEKYLSNVKFDKKKIKASKGDLLYLYSDGIVDQFGGTSEKKYGKKRLVKLIQKHSSKPANEQVEIIKTNILDWMESSQQLDDILMLILRL